MEDFLQSSDECIRQGQLELTMEYEAALDHFMEGKPLPIDKHLQAALDRISEDIAAARKEGSEAGEFEIMILCADEAKRIAHNMSLSDMVYTLYHCSNHDLIGQSPGFDE